MSSLSTLPKGDSAWLLRKSIQRIMQQVSVLETNIGSSTTGNSANTQIIFNDNGVLRGAAGLTFNKTTDLLTVGAATITGDLTVRTNKLAVTSTGVGVGTLSPNNTLTVRGSQDAGIEVNSADSNSSRIITAYDPANTRFYINSTSSGSGTVLPLDFLIGNSAQYRIAASGVFTWFDGAGGTRMTLNATGLGVGVASPATKLDVNGGTGGIGGQNHATFSGNAGRGLVIGTRSDNVSADRTATLNAPFTGGGIVLQTQGTDRLTIDSSGNVGIGVTPSAWGTGYTALQNRQTCWFATSARDLNLGANVYVDGVGYKYIATAAASNYVQYQGAHSWYNAASGTAGNAITFTQAMTLDASGNLLVGTTTNAGVRLDVQTTTGNCIGRVKSNAAASTASFIIDYVETLGCTYIKKAGSDVWIYGVQNDTSATPSFKINTASNVGVQLVSGATAWTTLSDETVKDIIEPISNAIAKVGSIRSVIGKFKTDDSNKRRSFLIAQDVQSVLPEAVDVVGENNELGLRYTEVIPLLVAAIKELTARVQTLETR